MNIQYVLCVGTVLILGFPSSGLCQTVLPVYDTPAYCRKVGQAAGGSYQIEGTCRESEGNAQRDLRSRVVIESRVLTYCDRVSSAVGGSYQILLQCVKNEEQAAADIRQLGPIEPRISDYCARISQAVGNSYAIELQCIKNEREAKSRLP
jgi:hypothetical protein